MRRTSFHQRAIELRIVHAHINLLLAILHRLSLHGIAIAGGGGGGRSRRGVAEHVRVRLLTLEGLQIGHEFRTRPVAHARTLAGGVVVVAGDRISLPRPRVALIPRLLLPRLRHADPHQCAVKRTSIAVWIGRRFRVVRSLREQHEVRRALVGGLVLHEGTWNDGDAVCNELTFEPHRLALEECCKLLRGHAHQYEPACCWRGIERVLAVALELAGGVRQAT
mmetsp:Transcript_11887/g.27508  ORF Transcript_11887/g.27508 Transcript_11887/m.27508 type:complete len:222 (+) Transcript_11887:1470-2135(+)